MLVLEARYARARSRSASPDLARYASFVTEYLRSGTRSYELPSGVTRRRPASSSIAAAERTTPGDSERLSPGTSRPSAETDAVGYSLFVY
ncbi:MAG: hypothetical protein OXU81_20050, partial [Gammaproteobacteria bacterium]|nr:hypothetical protein [Gammaproteobacteria bacterium]